jgi:hypothetical protein
MYENSYDNEGGLLRSSERSIYKHRRDRIGKAGPSKSFKLECLRFTEFWDD